MIYGHISLSSYDEVLEDRIMRGCVTVHSQKPPTARSRFPLLCTTLVCTPWNGCLLYVYPHFLTTAFQVVLGITPFSELLDPMTWKGRNRFFCP